VCVHYRLTDGKPFYVGKGCGKRDYKSSGRNSHWKNTRDKHGIRVEIVRENLSEDEALKLEIEYISKFRKHYDCLCNRTNGGDGCHGMLVSAETREKLSKSHTGRQKSAGELENIRKAGILRRGVKKPRDQVEKMRKTLTGKKHSDDTKKKMSETRKNGRTNVDHSIYVFFSKDDVFVGKRWELAKYVGIPTRKFRPMFDKQRQKVCQGWSVLKLNEFLILKEIIYVDRN
jgi:hypothetical protein